MSIFTKVAASRPKTSNFNLSHETKLSCNFGELIPINLTETLPGDKFNVSTELLIKLAPLKAPVMHRLKAYVHYFYIPHYQLWKDYDKFINVKQNKGDVIPPYFTPNHFTLDDSERSHYMSEYMTVSSLADYLGLPVTMSGLNDSNSKTFVSYLPFLAYQHVYNSYYRDQNLELLPSEGGSALGSVVDVEYWKNHASGAISSQASDLSDDEYHQQVKNLFTLRKRAWAKDYFTSALPSPQAGDDVLIPMSFNGDVITTLDSVPSGSQEGRHYPFLDLEEGTRVYGSMSVDSTPSIGMKQSVSASNTTATINDLRRAIQLQRFKELAERGGTRIPEILQNFFGVHIPDYMVDRPIYLGGQSVRINVGEVVQTSQSTTGEEGSALGSLAGKGSGYANTKGVHFRAPMHGFFMGILSIRPEGTYSQGIERMWTRQSIWDYAWPQFANIGEQEILQKEIYCDGSADDDKVFGYTPRYAEYKEGHTQIAGKFRTDLQYWHFGRKFENAPKLNKEFVMMDQMNYEPFNVTSDETEHVYVDLWTNIHARRALPYFGTPAGLI